jgi:co-chaperonin GroES (HSP10)
LFGRNTEEVTGDLRKFRDEKRKFYSASGIVRLIGSRRIRDRKNVTPTAQVKNAQNVLVSKHEGKKLLWKGQKWMAW